MPETHVWKRQKNYPELKIGNIIEITGWITGYYMYIQESTGKISLINLLNGSRLCDQMTINKDIITMMNNTSQIEKVWTDFSQFRRDTEVWIE